MVEPDGPGRARTRLEPERRREQILDAAEGVFRRREPTEVTFEAVADAASVSRALVYNYFGDRNGLVAAVYVRALQRLDQVLLDALDPDVLPAQQLRTLSRAYLAFARSNGAMGGLLGTTGAVQHPAVQVARRSRYERLAALWGAGAEARIVARAVTGMLEVASVDWLDEGVDPEVVVEVVCRLLEPGLEQAGIGPAALTG